MIKEAIARLANGEDIGYETAKEVMNEIMSGEASDIQKSAYLTALSMKGETIEEITGSAEEMRNHCVRLLNDMDVLEIVGTGGDRSNSFNISTTSALVIAAGGVPVAKHGNRAASSKCGAADVLEALGVNITIAPARSAELLRDIGICFLFAQKYHTAMRYVGPVRRELGIRTIFNILGPLANPAGANMEVMGVYDETLVEPLARVLVNLGVKRAMVVYGMDKLDEISMSAKTYVCEVKDGDYKTYYLEPEQFGFVKCDKKGAGGRYAGRKCRHYPEHTGRRKRAKKRCGGIEFRSCALYCRKGRKHGSRSENGRRYHFKRQSEEKAGRVYSLFQQLSLWINGKERLNHNGC